MKSFGYWVGATILVVALLGGIFLGGNFISDQRWPFAAIWGGFMAVLGLALVIIGRAVPHVLWGMGPRTSVDPRMLRLGGWIATVFGALIVIGGVGFALTARVGILIGALVMGAIFLRFALGSSPGGDASGPAA